METSPLRRNRTLLLILTAALAVICLCLCGMAAAGAGWFYLSSQGVLPEASPATQQEIQQQMDEIQQQVTHLRGLSAAGEISRTLITTEQLRLNVTEDFLKDYTPEDAQQAARVLSAFGLVESGFDLYTFYLELFTEQIAGYYDNETKEMFVVQDTGFNAMERLTYAHEFTHVLQDQTYDIQDGLGFNEEDCEDFSERCLGVQALLEGDASFLELQWFDEYATMTDRLQMLRYASETQGPIYENAPPFMKEDFLFPYTQGYTFVEHLYDQGGWSAVNQAYTQPPVSSEQILHPELYPAENPLEIALPDLTVQLGDGWSEIEAGVVGEWYTFLILAHGADPEGHIEAETARQAAAGWGGDVYAVYLNQNDNKLALVLISEWDAVKDATEFEQAFRDYLRGRFGQEAGGSWSSPQGEHFFIRQGNRTIWLMAPVGETALEVWASLTNP